MKKISLVNRFFGLSEKLMLMLPDWVTGRSDIMKQKYYKKYGARDYRGLIRRNKIRTMSAYLCITAAALVLIIYSMFADSDEDREIISITRPENGQPVQSVPVEVEMRYGGVVLTKDITLTVGQRALTEQEKQSELGNFRKSLESKILGENKDLDHISKPLNLLDRDPKTGITIEWISEDPEIVSESGEVNLIRAEGTRTVGLKAVLTLDDEVLNVTYKLKIDGSADEEDYERSLALSLKAHLAELKKTGLSDRIPLPGQLEDGVEVHWYSGTDDQGGFLAPAIFFLLLIVYFKRYDRIDKEIREAEASVSRDLPEFMNKLVLLLNAGLVFSTAFSKIIEDYESFWSGGNPERTEKKYLYEEMLEIKKRVDQSNTSLIRELKEFSQRCGVREMVRLTSVISDNWNKGSTLTEKLESESNILWINRKKRAEEKGKLAETKLTFPLVILLLVLIMITIAPAMLEM